MAHTLRTERLLLRPATLEDAGGLARAFNHFELTKETKTWPYPVTEEHCRFRIEQWAKNDPLDQHAFLIVYQGEIAGSIGLQRRRGTRWSTGYGIAPWLWGQGLCTEALKAVCRFAFDVLGAEAVEADVFQDNLGSQAVALKAGFVFVGDIGEGWSTTLQGNFPRFGYELTREGLTP